MEQHDDPYHIPYPSDETVRALVAGALVNRDLLQAVALLPPLAYPPKVRWLRLLCVDAVAGQITLEATTLQQAVRDRRWEGATLTELSEVFACMAGGPSITKREGELALAVVRARWDRYRAHVACKQALAGLASLDADPLPVLAALVDGVRHITEQTPERGPQSMPDLIASMVDYLSRQPDVERAPSIPALAEAIGAYHRGTVTIVGGRPGMGKSAFLAGEMMALADRGVPVFLQTLEMTGVQTFARLLSSRYGADAGGLIRRDPTAVARGLRTIADEHDELTRLPIYLDDTPATIETIIATARALKERKGLGAVFVDYLQIITPTDARIPREQQISHMSFMLRQAAKELDVPFVVAAQLNRESVGRKGAKPMLSDLRESGAIEQDATTILFPFRPDYAEGVTNAGERKGWEPAQIIVAKSRYSGIGIVPCRWEGKSSRFVASDFSTMNPDGISRASQPPPPMPDYDDD